MKTEHIPYILTVAATKSINKASVKCNYPAQKLCNIMTNMENEFDTQFFIRNRQGVSLTPAGELFIKRLEQINEIVTATRLDLKSALSRPEKLTGEIEFYYISLLDDDFIVNLLKTFREQYPDVILNIQNVEICDLVAKIKNNPHSIGIYGWDKRSKNKVSIALKENADILSYPVFRNQPVVLFKKESPFIDTKQKSVSLTKLQDIPLVSFNALEDLFLDYVPNIQYIRSKELFFEKLHHGNCYSIIALNDLTREAFLQKYPDLDIMPVKDFNYFETSVILHEKSQNDNLNKAFLNFLYDFRDTYFYLSAEWNSADYVVYERPIF